MAITPDDAYPLDTGRTPADGLTPTNQSAAYLDGIRLRLDTIAADLQPDITAVGSVLSDMSDYTAHLVYDAHAEMTAGVADLIGTIDGGLAERGQPVQAAVERIVSAADKALTQSGYDLYSAGVSYPGDTTTQSALLAADDADLLLATLPQLAESTNMPGTVDCAANPGDPVCVQRTPGGGSSPPSPPASPPAATDPVGECIHRVAYPLVPGDPMVDEWVDSITGEPCDPTSPPTAPPPPEPPPPEPPADPCPAVCAPVGVTMGVVDSCGNTTPVTIVGTPLPVPPVVVVTGKPIATVPPYPPPPPVPPPPRIPDKVVPTKKASAQCLDWDVIDPCAVGTFYTSTLPTQTGSAPAGKADGGSWWDDFVTVAGTAVKMAIPGYALLDAGSNLLTGNSMLANFAVTHDFGKRLANDLIDTFTGKCVDNKGQVAALSVLLGAANWSETITGAPIRYLSQSNIYQFQFLNPQFLPVQSDNDNLYLRGKISDGTWECLTKAQGNLPAWHRAARNAKQSLLTPDQLVQYWRRGHIADAQLTDTLTENGFINANYQVALQLLSEQPLTLSDITTCMVRDSFDDKVALKYDYDKDFKDKFSGKAEEWAYWQGMSKEQFRYIWRAHWKLPSDTALYTMLHRLRPDRQAVKDWELIGAKDDNGDPDPNDPARPPTVTRADAVELLEVNDMAPAWVNRMIAISYHPITNSDAARMYQLGYFDDQQLITAFRDNGYTEEDATTIQGFWKYETAKRIRNQSGVLTPRKCIELYKDGAIDRNELRKNLSDLFPNADQLDQLISQTDDQMSAVSKQAKAKSIKRSLITGEYAPVEAIAALQNIGVNREAANRLVDTWSSEQQHRSKEATAMMLCKWRDRGLITTDQHVERLVRLGYPEPDAKVIARVCDMDSAKRRAKETLAASKAAARDAKTDLLKQIADARKKLAELAAEYTWYMEQLGLTPGHPPTGQSSSPGGGGG